MKLFSLTLILSVVAFIGCGKKKSSSNPVTPTVDTAEVDGDKDKNTADEAAEKAAAEKAAEEKAAAEKAAAEKAAAEKAASEEEAEEETLPSMIFKASEDSCLENAYSEEDLADEFIQEVIRALIGEHGYAEGNCPGDALAKCVAPGILGGTSTEYFYNSAEKPELMRKINWPLWMRPTKRISRT